LQLEANNGRLKKEVSIDTLTGAYNRRAFRSMLDAAIEQRDRYEAPFVFAIIDIDHFKRVNDTYGHQKGDEVLKSIGKHLQQQIRQSDALIRYGGEEFVICFNSTRLEQAIKVMEKIRLSIERLELLENSSITISGGLSELRSDDIVSSLMRRADKALYAAKASGRNAIFIEESAG
jgi:diguanylate cyclase (GGDEF)-like protein